MDQLNQLRSDFKSRNDQLLTENENLVNELKTANDSKIILENSHAELEKNLQSEISTLKLELEDKTVALQNLQQNRSSLDSDINGLRKEVLELQKQLSQSEQSGKLSVKNFEALEKQKVVADEKLADFIKKYKNDVDTVKTQLFEKDEQISCIMDELEQQKKLIAESDRDQEVS